MERYKSNEKLKNKQSTFSMLRDFFKTARETEDKWMEICDKLEKVEKGTPEYEVLDKEATKLEKKLARIKKSKDAIRKTFMAVGAIAIGAAIVVTGTISAITNKIQSNKNEMVLKALADSRPGIVDTYKNDEDKLKSLTESPEEVTQLALDNLKSKLAEHYGVPNIDDFEVIYKTTAPEHTRYQSTEYYQVFYKGEAISEHITEYISGDTTTIKDTMPDELIDAIDAIVVAQEAPEDSFKAFRALKVVQNKKVNEGISTGLPQYLPTIEDYER